MVVIGFSTRLIGVDALNYKLNCMLVTHAAHVLDVVALNECELLEERNGLK